MPNGSPRSAAAARSSLIMRVSRPALRCVAETVTFVSAAAATTRGPGTVNSVANERNVPTTRPSSSAAQVRSKSTSPAK